jgi:hypothetical protein
MDHDPRWRAAVHEAGHATVARLLRLPHCGQAAVEPTPHAVINTECGPPSICALMAGAAAEAELLGNFDEFGCALDLERWTQLLERHGYRDGGAALWDYTARLVRWHRGRVALTAIKLKRQGVLDAAALDRIVLRG